MVTEKISHPSLSVRLEAVASLRELGEEALPSWAIAAQDPVFDVRWEALSAISSLIPVIGEAAVQNPDGLISFVERWGVLVVEALGASITDPTNVRETARSGLVRLVIPLYELTLVPEYCERLMPTVQGLLSLATQALIRGLQDPWASQRFWCADALGAIGAVDAVAALERCLEDPDKDVPDAASRALARLGSRGVRSLVAALHHHDPRIRWRPARALGLTNDASVVPDLVMHLRDPHELVSAGAAASLANLGDRGLASIVEAYNCQDEDLRELLANAVSCATNPRSVPGLRRLLGHSDSRLRLSAVKSLGRVGDPAAVRALRRALRSDHAGLRDRAATVLDEVLTRTRDRGESSTSPA